MSTSREQGILRLKEGRFAEAAGSLADAVAQDASDVGAWRLLGGALSALEDTAGAVAAFQRTVELDGSQPKNHYNLALALQAAGDRVGARQHFSHALRLDPHYEQAGLRLRELESLPTAPPSAPEPPPRIPPPPPPPSYSATVQSYAPPPTLGSGAYGAPPPVYGYGQAQRTQEPVQRAYGQAPRVNGTNIMVLGILGIALFPVLSPFAWYHGNRAMELLKHDSQADPQQRANANTGRILGMVGTFFLVITFLIGLLIGLAGGFR
ncbi:tetratricopeptide repeat protein [Armatimonas sp.]|uniref:tetratricopeptide repeat protein n=1 Tax=Armatimonas sp. TaxID=1872638 RepID=UPI00286A0E85|nr:tetratricopeptide repeat protein [Armatimonas sp.]